MIKQDKKVSLKISSELLSQLEIVAAKNDRTVSSMIRIILKEYFTNLAEKRHDNDN